jgi:shikimate dehydrogenase
VLFELGEGQTLIDLPYPRTATAEAAVAAGAQVLDGLEVLVAQGAASFELWTGLSAPVAEMRGAVGLT